MYWSRSRTHSYVAKLGLKDGVQETTFLNKLQSLRHIRLSVTSQTAAHQACLSSISWSLLILMYIEWVMPSNHLILCHCLLLLPSFFPASGSFSVSWLFTSSGQRSIAELYHHQLNHIFQWVKVMSPAEIKTSQTHSERFNTNSEMVSSSILWHLLFLLFLYSYHFPN